MVEQENLDVRTITMGISLLDCCDENLEKLNEKIYEKITRLCEEPGIDRRGDLEGIWNPDRE